MLNVDGPLARKIISSQGIGSLTECTENTETFSKKLVHCSAFSVLSVSNISVSNEKNPWTTLSVREIYENRWIKVDEHQVLNPSGGKGIYGKIHFKNKAIGIVALDQDNNTWLVGQWRYPLNQWSWEIPEGGGSMDHNPLERELKEETGFTAKSWKMIVRTHLSNSVSDEEGFIFLAEELVEGNSELEETEADLKVWKLPVKEALQMVLDGKITDSLSVMGLLAVARIKNI
jgi:8-oxo-dGTP pyrophosphatase MutT (NUDIX family)